MCCQTNQVILGITSALSVKYNSSLLISYVAPHKPVSSKSIAGWVVETLSSIATTTFKARSTRSGSTSVKDLF